MEMFVRGLLIIAVPIFQLMMVVWRVQQKITISIGGTAFLCFVLSFLFANWAASISVGAAPTCAHCTDARIINSIFAFLATLITNWLFNILVSLLGLGAYKAVLKRMGY